MAATEPARERGADRDASGRAKGRATALPGAA
jgi:hypothetical protein